MPTMPTPGRHQPHTRQQISLPPAPEPSYAGWWHRAAAYVIDIGLAGVPTLFVVSLGLALTAPTEQEYSSYPETGATWLAAAITVLGLVVYVTIAVSNQVVRQGRTGQSLGKKWLGIAVVEESTGRPLGPARALLRWGAQLTINLFGNQFFLGLPSLLNVLWPLWDDKHQTWHDKTVGSIVVTIR